MFTKATIVAWNGERGIAYDYLETPIYFTKEQVHPNDILGLDIGGNILYNGSGQIELVTNSFSRWIEDHTFDVGSTYWRK
jgi:hypothetical protein